MMKRVLILGLAAVAMAGASVVAQAPRFRVLEPGFPLWAYGYKQVPKDPQDWSGRCPGNTPRDCDRPGGMPTDQTGEKLTIPGTNKFFTVAEITSPYRPADWYPEDHPPMPPIVANGKEATRFRACAICHYPNGLGLMQNGPVAGLRPDYFIRQLTEMANGKRKSADINKANAWEMAAMARNLTPDEAQQAADYFASLPYKQWIRVIESPTVPVFTATINGLFLDAPGDETEPIGRRIVEMPEDSYQANMLRNPRVGLRAYVPPGSLKAGETLVMTGGNGKTQACGTCHGPDMRGTAIAPPLAGRHPGYMARQLYDFQVGARNGDMAVMMKPSVEKLTEDDLIAITAYLASLKP